MSKNDIYITLILGPGNHQEKLIDAIKETGFSFEVYNYYPKFTITKYNSKKEIVSIKTNRFYTLVVKLIWSIFIRIKFLKKTNIHIYYSHYIYDFWVSKNFAKTSKLLWAWSQVSLLSIKKFKLQNGFVITESPTIHITEWIKVMDSEYSLYAKDKYQYYKIHDRLSKRIISEYQLSDKILVLSSYAKDTFIKHGIANNKLHRINLYADDGYIKNTSIIENNEIVKFLFVGRVDVLKGIPRLIEVLTKISMEHGNFSLTIVGEMKEEVEDLFSAHLAFIRIMKPVNKIELKKIYLEHDVLILPSVQESFGLVLLEALSNGLIVMASNNSGAPDIAKECDKVILFNPFDKSELEQNILSLINGKFINSKCQLSSYNKENYEGDIFELIKTQLNTF